MRPFYISKRNNGYYRVRFVDPVSKRMTVAKSTHKKTYDEALTVVYQWLQNGVPVCSANASSEKAEKTIVSVSQKLNYVACSQILNTGDLSDEQAQKLLLQLQLRIGEQPTTAQVQIPDRQEENSVTDRKRKLKNDISGKKLVEYLVEFWTPEQSKYIRDRRARGKKIGERHCYEMRNRAKNYWSSYFAETIIGAIDNEDLSDFFLDLRETRNLSGSTINNVMNAGVVALKWAYEHKMLAENMTEGVERFAVENRARGILTEDEAQRLFALDWKDNRAKAANLLAMTTGMRAGEILALRPCDIKDTYIDVRHSWNDKDGLKSPKNGKARRVPLIAQMRSILIQLASSNPHGVSPTNFIFYSTLPDRPVVINVLIDNLILELVKIGINEEERQERNIVFHSWRHYYATEMTRRVEMAQAQQALGHLTPEMTKHYADHKTIEDLEVIEKAANEAFANIIPFMVSA